MPGPHIGAAGGAQPLQHAHRLGELPGGEGAGGALRRLTPAGVGLPQGSGGADEGIPQQENALVQQGALGASMSGTGSTVFGLFDREEAARRAYELLQESYRDTFLARSLEKMV